ncbi:putative short chain type dehydrogenase [Cucurbitaria berberidis CBS 394.84]|uniref:Short chain type dehydrogenase n=1 Tax=Cucurbitaria berberidis CBS 394.84 TaxID=1168544 RepID=A0A9P4GIQ6_9PLEO|nr:putative short chain type dehydrogenase [Cucurbitaria berberidis CBS 394.84]KAF1846377.1 putative short chain type dehydrogenase [Cucurbitaria berberidis CBS 394.84]
MSAYTFPTFPDLKDKIVLVMGIGQTRVEGSSIWGNGAATARAFCSNGCKVFGCDINLTAAEFTATRLRDEGGICDVMAADVTSSSDVKKVVDAVMEKYGRIDVLVNNVGMTRPGTPGSISEEVWDQQMDLNLKSVYLSCHHVLPIMEKQNQGAVVNNASIAGVSYIGKAQVAYSTAKAAIIHFTRVSAVMYAPKGVRLNCVVPGFILVPLVENLGKSDKEEDREVYRKITQHNVPMGRMGEPEDVANAALWLASAASKYVTGQPLVVDGGLTSQTGTGQ